MQLLSQDHELPEPSVPATSLEAGRSRLVRPPFAGTGPAEEGNILCNTRRADSIRWIVYELRDGKVERGARKRRSFRHRGGFKNEAGPRYATLLRQHREHAKEPPSYFLTTRLFFTSNTFGTVLARNPARFLSVSLSTTPSKLRCPLFTMI